MLGWMVVRLLARAEPMEPAVVERPALELLDHRLAQGELDAATRCYQVVRNLPGHYRSGMDATRTVS